MAYVQRIDVEDDNGSSAEGRSKFPARGQLH